ncbi:triose-phosphate isomerase [Candidatus Omnitrophota bacterium]
MRKKVIAGNWKMYKTVPESINLVNAIKAGVQKFNSTEIVVCPSFTNLNGVAGLLDETNIGLGAQNMHTETEGAYTGEISPLMLKDIGCRYVIIGHSERRQYFGETDESVNAKLKVAISYNLAPIVCIGETLTEREAGKTEQVIEKQFFGAFEGISNKDMAKIIIAYEPVWAIGTGKTATPRQAEDVHRLIRLFLSQNFAKEVSDNLRILYGGSVKPDNSAELLKQRNIDGALVGGASLKAESFIQIVEAAEEVEDKDVEITG